MNNSEKLCRASARALIQLPTVATEEVRVLLTPENIATMTAMTSLWLGTQGVPIVGQAVDAALLTLGVTILSIQAADLAQDLWAYGNRALTAQSDADLDVAATSLARAISKAGINVVAYVLMKKVVSTAARAPPPPGAPAPALATGEAMAVAGSTTPAGMVTARDTQGTSRAAVPVCSCHPRSGNSCHGTRTYYESSSRRSVL